MSYDGEWELGVIHGKGTLVTFGGDVYKGSFSNGAVRIASGLISIL